MNNIKQEKGFISLFVIFSMLFLLVFILVIYTVVENKEKNENTKKFELKEIYSENVNEINESLYASTNDVIPIYNIREFNIVGTGNYIQIKNKIYQCSRNKQYVLKENIIVDIVEDLKSVEIGFNDYKFFSAGFNIDKNIYDIYYYYQGNYWKVLAYQKFNKKDQDKSFVSRDVSLEDRYSIINSYNFSNSNLDFMFLYSDDKENKKNILIESQNVVPNSLENIKVFFNNKKLINKENGEYYVLVNIGNNI